MWFKQLDHASLTIASKMMLGEHKHLMTQWHTVSKWRRRITEEIHRLGNVGGLNFPAVTTERKYSTDYYSRGCCNWIHKHTTHTCLATVISWTWIRNPSPSCNQITLHPLSQQLHSHDVPGLPVHDRIKAFFYFNDVTTRIIVSRSTFSDVGE